MNSSPRTTWKRLHDIVEERMSELAMLKEDLPDHRGPSASWFRGLQHRTGRPTMRMKSKLDALDTAMGWPENTSWGLAREDFEDGSAAAEDQEETLIHMPPPDTALPPHEKAIRDFATSVMGTLREKDAREADALMLAIYRMLGI
jgi:hypothetical protein